MKEPVICLSKSLVQNLVTASVSNLMCSSIDHRIVLKHFCEVTAWFLVKHIKKFCFEWKFRGERAIMIEVLLHRLFVSHVVESKLPNRTFIHLSMAQNSNQFGPELHVFAKPKDFIKAKAFISGHE